MRSSATAEQISAVVVDDAVQQRALRQIREPMQHRRLVARRHAVDRVRERVRDVRVAGVVDGHVVREVARRRGDRCAEIDHREPLAGRQVVDAELRVAAGVLVGEHGAVRVRDEQRSRSSSASMPTDDTSSASRMNGTTRPSRSMTKIVPSASEPVRKRPLSSSYSMPSGMKPPRSAVMTATVAPASGWVAGAATVGDSGGGDVRRRRFGLGSAAGQHGAGRRNERNRLTHGEALQQ